MVEAEGFEAVIGLEIHVQLRTRTKLFCGCSPEFGAPPNTRTCPVCLGLPGALPVPNRRAVELALRVALALGCRLPEHSHFERKNYFYPDLPKGYQISQYERPLGQGGSFEFLAGGSLRRVGVRRVHLEEDAGKSAHGQGGTGEASLIDLNRCGTPLLEVVTAPELRSPSEASDFLVALRAWLLALGVTDANMQEGSLRCDANVSVRRRGSAEMNPKVEVKNLNSFRFLRRALAYETRRQAELLAGGRVPEQATRTWDEASGRTRPMRSKEEAQDYRYFPDPDLVPVSLPADRRRRASAGLPETFADRLRRWQRRWPVEADAAWPVLLEPERADFLERMFESGVPAKAALDWLQGPVQAWLNEQQREFAELPLSAEALAELIAAVCGGTVSAGGAKRVLAAMLETGRPARELVRELGLELLDDREQLAEWVADVVASCPAEVAAYRAGRDKVLGRLIGQVMQRSGGRADARLVRELLREAIES